MTNNPMKYTIKHKDGKTKVYNPNDVWAIIGVEKVD